MTEPRIQPLMAGGKCLGHIIRSARGVRAFDHNDVELGTFASAEQAISAISARLVPSSAAAGDKR